MTFEKACPSGNIMEQQQSESGKHECEYCDGSGIDTATAIDGNGFEIPCKHCDGFGYWRD